MKNNTNIQPYQDYRDALGKQLQVGDYVLYTQKKYSGCKLFAYGTIIETVNEKFPLSVLIKRMTPRKRGKFKEIFPSVAYEVIKVSQEEIALRILEEGNSRFIR